MTTQSMHETTGAAPVPREAAAAAPGIRENVEIAPGERVDDLMNGRYVIQDPAYFRFGMDAVLLAHFPQVRKRDRVLDLGCGNGVIPLIMSAESGTATFTGLEIQPRPADMARRSAALSGEADRIRIIEGDIREAAAIFGPASFSLVTCNPPYMPAGKGLQNPEGPLAVARHEVMVTLPDVVGAAAAVLKEKGRFAIIHRPSRLPELMALMKEARLTPKRMRLVYPGVTKEPNLVLVEGTKGGGSFFRVEPPLVVYDEEGNYTEEILKIYGMTASGK